MAWLVQARWTLAEKSKSFQPVIVRSRWQARRVAADMHRTLAHFPDLDVLVRPATVEDKERDAEHRVAVAAGPLPVVHLAHQADRTRTSCGENADAVGALVFDADLLPSDRACPSCTRGPAAERH